ncbi:MAG TPA: carboxymuconolactone decarboxylase family protein [Candidatus Binatia bacterium]|jgi:alkylhydroperoxidase family enzyme|nr:carboxymuconolactone decarboxylase family protein [Candidatus Binatia bacterium]
MARLPYVDPATAPEAVRSTLEKLPVQLNIFRMMAHAETDFRPLIQLGTAILSQQALSPKLRELAILRVGQQSPAEYEWVQHVPIALATGATQAQVDALKAGSIDGPAFDEVERAVLAFVTDVLRNVKASDATFAEVGRFLSHREIVELVVTTGYYMLIARLLETTAVDLDRPMGTRIVDSLT